MEELLRIVLPLGYTPNFAVTKGGKDAYLELMLIHNWLITKHQLIILLNASITGVETKYCYMVIDKNRGMFDEKTFSKYEYIDHKDAIKVGCTWAAQYLTKKNEENNSTS